MTRRELIRHVVERARAHGFDFQQWYQKNIEPEWTGFEPALRTLENGRRYYALLFSHDFASNFWKKGTQIAFLLPSHEYTRLDRHGNIVTIQRKPFTRRTSRSGSSTVWQYHLEQMALWEEPLRYIRRFILTQDDLELPGGNAAAVPPAKKRRGPARRRTDWC
jgi:hypothetical protein